MWTLDAQHVQMDTYNKQPVARLLGTELALFNALPVFGHNDRVGAVDIAGCNALLFQLPPNSLQTGRIGHSLLSEAAARSHRVPPKPAGHAQTAQLAGFV